MKRTVIVIGDEIKDVTRHCVPAGMSAENAQAPVLRVIAETITSGGAGNVVSNLHGLGAHCVYLSPLEWLSAGVSGFSVPIKTRYYGPAGLLFRADREDPRPLPADYWTRPGYFLPDYLPAVSALIDPKKYILDRPVVCLVDYDKGTFLNEHANAQLRGILGDTITLADPGRAGWWERTATSNALIRANVQQCLAFYRVHADQPGVCAPWTGPVYDARWCATAAQYEHLARTMQHNLYRTGVPYRFLVLTLGAGGLIAAGREPDEPPCLFEADYVPSEAADPCGAGDTVTAALAAKLAQADAYDFEAVRAACVYAVTAATVAVRHRGVYAVQLTDVETDDASTRAELA